MKRLLLLVAILLIVSPSVVAQQSWCGIQTLYFQHNESITPAGYEELINYPSGNPEVIENVTVINTAGPVLIDNYIMPVGSLADTSELLQGLRRYRFYAYVSSAVGVTRFNFTAFRRFANGTEQNFYTGLSEDIDALSVTEYDFNYVSQANLALNPTDRLGIRVSANTSHSSNIQAYWVYQGTAHASHFESGYFVCEPSATVPVYAQQVQTPLEIWLLPIALLCATVILIRRKN